MRDALLCVKSGISSSTNTSLQIWQRLISLPVGRSQGDVTWWSKGLESKGHGVARKIMNQFRSSHLGSKRPRGKKSPSLAPQFTRSYARSKLQFRITRKSTNWVKKPRRDWRCNGIRLIQGSVQFWCLKEISEDGIQALIKVSHSLVWKGIILTTQFQEKVGLWWHLTSEPRINVGMSNKLLCRPGVSKLINLIPDHHTRITRCNAHCRFRVNCVIGWNQT